MQPANRLFRLRRSLAEVGLARTIIRIIRKLYRRAFPIKIPTHPFDLQYGVNTSGFLTPRKLASGHPHDSHITAYWGTAPSLLNGAVCHWIATLPATLAIEDYTFIDIGCGKGRAVMLASEFPFRRVIGIELNPALTEIARQNLVRWQLSPHPCASLEILNLDALAIPLPRSPTLIYLFNPFDAHVTELLLDRIRELSIDRSSPIDVIYARPEYANLFRRIPNMQLLWDGEIPFTPEETSADFVRTLRQDCHIYRLAASSQGVM